MKQTMKGIWLGGFVLAVLAAVPLRAEFRQVNITTFGMD